MSWHDNTTVTKRAAISIIAGLEERIAQFAANCIHICDHLPRGKAGARNFKDQLARSATSAAANYAEASVPSSQRDFIVRLTIALKELAESRMHLSIIRRLDYRRNVDKSIVSELVDEADAIAAILHKALGSSGRKTPKPAKTENENPASPITELLQEVEVEPRNPPGRPGRKKKKKKKNAPADSESPSTSKTPARRKTPTKKKTTQKTRKTRTTRTTRATRTTTTRSTRKMRATRATATKRMPRNKGATHVRRNAPPAAAATISAIPATPQHRIVLLPVFTPPPALPPPPQFPLLTYNDCGIVEL